MKNRNIIFVITIVLSCHLSAQTTYYVDASNGNDDNTGLNEKEAFRRIGYASGQIAPGDTLKVMPGDYFGGYLNNLWNEVFIAGSGTPGNYITYQGVPDAEGNFPRIISSSVQGMTVYEGAYIIIENFEIMPSMEDTKGLIDHPDFGLEFWRGRSGISILNESHHIIVRNNYVHDFPGGGINSGGCDVIRFEGNLVEHCGYGADNATSGMGTYQMKDIDVPNFPEYPNHRVIFKDNVSRYNVNLRGFIGPIGNNRVTDGNGIIIDDHLHEQSNDPQPYSGRSLLLGNVCYGNGGRGINLFSSHHIDVYNNTLFDNAQTTRIAHPVYEIAIGDNQLIIGRVDDANIRNNIMVNTNHSTTTVESYEASNITYNQNIHWNSNGNPELLSDNDIIADPLFVHAQGLTQSQTNLLGTLTNPYDEYSISASVRTPTLNNGFPVQDLRLLSGSIAIDTAEDLEFQTFLGTAPDIGALEFDPDNPPVEPIKQEPFGNNGQPLAIANGAVIIAGEYDTGGEGLAFHEVDASHSNGCDRNDEVDVLDNCAIGFIASEEWLEYTVNVTEATHYNIRFFAASPNEGKTVRLLLGDQDLGTFILPTTSGYDDYQPSILENIFLQAGKDILRVEFIDGDFNYEKIEFETTPGTVIVAAYGATGEETFELQLDGVRIGETQIATLTPSEYIFNVTDSGLLRVVFTNNGNTEAGADKNLNVDYVIVNDEIRHAEDQPINTGSWNNDLGQCGGVQSAWLYCSGYIEFGEITGVEAEQTSYGNEGDPWPVYNDVLLQAEFYDTGGQGIAFNDTDDDDENGIRDGCGRTDQVDIGEDEEGNCFITWTNPGEWLEYTIDATAGIYNIEMRVATSIPGTARFLFNDEVLGTIDIPDTGGFDNFQMAVLTDIELPEEEGIFRMEMNGYYNFDYFQFRDTAILNIPNTIMSNSAFSLYPNPVSENILNIVLNNVLNNEVGTIQIFDLTGKTIMTQFINSTRKITIDTSPLSNGIYIIKISSKKEHYTKLLSIQN